jgi:Protein of unknown function (DUF2490)
MVDLKNIATVVLRSACVIFVILSFVPTTPAQDSERTEFWPEVDVFIRLTKKVRLSFVAAVTRVEETRESTEIQLAGRVDFLINKRFTLRSGYQYHFAPSPEDQYKEHRVIIEQTFRHPLPLKVMLSDRNREELRFINGNFSTRYRNRIMLEREVVLKRLHITPYGSAEVFYDGRFDAWNRNRLNLGVQVPLKRGLPIVRLLDPSRVLVLDVYFMRQLDSRSQPSRVRGLGLNLNVYL